LGEITLILPTAVGVRVAVDQGLGNVNAADLQEEAGNVYVNEAYETAAVTLDIEIDQAAGDINLRVAE
jgi:predicted membrane protein